MVDKSLFPFPALFLKIDSKPTSQPGPKNTTDRRYRQHVKKKMRQPLPRIILYDKL